jgi:hypothetical protein
MVGLQGNDEAGFKGLVDAAHPNVRPSSTPRIGRPTSKCLLQGWGDSYEPSFRHQTFGYDSSDRDPNADWR